MIKTTGSSVKVTSGEAPVAKKPVSKPTHPSTADMVKSAIDYLDERSGSSLQAIKKYIAATYLINMQKFAPLIRKFLKSAVTKGTLVQTKGIGATGSFKLAAEKASKPKKAAVKISVKPPTAKQSDEVKSLAKKPISKKEPAGLQKKPVTKVPAKSKEADAPPKAKKLAKSPTKPKSPAKSKAAAPSKAKKTVKSPTAKRKSPKPKKLTAPKTAKAKAKKNSED